MLEPLSPELLKYLETLRGKDARFGESFPCFQIECSQPITRSMGCWAGRQSSCKLGCMETLAMLSIGSSSPPSTVRIVRTQADAEKPNGVLLRRHEEICEDEKELYGQLSAVLRFRVQHTAGVSCAKSHPHIHAFLHRRSCCFSGSDVSCMRRDLNLRGFAEETGLPAPVFPFQTCFPTSWRAGTRKLWILGSLVVRMQSATRRRAVVKTLGKPCY